MAPKRNTSSLTTPRTTRSSSGSTPGVQRKVNDIFKSTTTKRRDDTGKIPKKLSPVVSATKKSRKEFNDDEGIGGPVIPLQLSSTKTDSTSALPNKKSARDVTPVDAEEIEASASDEDDGRVPVDSSVTEELEWNLPTIPRRNKNAIEIHQEHMKDSDKLLRAFDLNYAYGPCVGLSRLERWERAKTLGLDPPGDVWIMLTSEPELGQNLFHGQV
ncbi:DNA polymerase delta, subunit 4-domain-containing protein [Jimgerdemannia flammicorona]|uniref:DNA polymerase delta, subunit 4-domain-containing protein n=1 Tax=Jimgerdemannia flammicorona TaxID=994334 RepID=A0A433D8N8_9FUNG|nr:DNA polymerase delta, subunit 4-domain-containing protein [Jimgerdemannia flammicorona]